MKSVWKRNPRLEKKLSQLLKKTNFFKENGFEGLINELNKETEEKISRKGLKSKVGAIVWTGKNLLKLEPFKYRTPSDKEMEKTFPELPVDFVRRKIERVRHKKRPVPERALGFADSRQMELSLHLEPTSLKNPLVLNVKDSENPLVEIVNSPQVGLMYPRDIKKSVLRNKIIMAQAENADAIIITGNLLHLDLKRTSINKPNRSVLSGMHVKPDILVKGEVYDNEEEVKNFLLKDDVVFIPMRQRLETLMDGISKLFRYKNQVSIFKGQVIVQLGLAEDEIISRAAYEELRIRVAIIQNRINSEIKALNKEIKKEERAPHKRRIRNRIDVLTKRLKNASMYQANDEFLQKWREKFAAWMIKEIEKAIPNSKVVSIGEAHFRLGENGPVIQSIPVSHTRTSDTELHNQTQKIRASTHQSHLPEVVLISGKTSIEHRWVRAGYMDKENNLRYSTIIQTPVLLDRMFLKSLTKSLVKVTEPIQRMLDKENLYTGTVGVEFVQVGSKWILKQNKIDSNFLANPENFTKERLQLINTESPAIMYMAREGDVHEGHPYKTLYSVETKPFFKLHDEAFVEFLLETDAPILNWMNMGDILQGRHFENQNAPHHRLYKRSHRFIKEVEKLLSSNKPRNKKLEELAKMSIFQVIRTGEVRPQDQELNYKERFLKNENFLNLCAKIIKKHKEYGIKSRGEYGPVVILAGDHMTKTHNRQYIESTSMRGCLVEALKGFVQKNGIDLSEEEIEKWVKAPMVGEHGSGFGAFGFQDVLYGVGFRHKQESPASKYGDTTKKAASSRNKRGSHTSYQHGLWKLDFRGDAHMGGGSCSAFGDYLATGCQTDPDPFGEWFSFPPPYIGSDIEGIPVEGPYSGKRVTISIDREVMEEWLRTKKIDKKKLFKNAIGK